jgi:Raf kinase inhibitor-like YbhB/YbcL family protein
MRLTSPAFTDGERIPKRYTEDGENVSPPLRWMDAPEKTREFALIVDDPDAPREHPWVHWVMYGVPGDEHELHERVPRREELSELNGAQQGVNSWTKNNIGYRGPAPPPGHGTHHYRFHLYALDRRMAYSGGLTKDALLKAMEGHILAEAELVGTYER